MRHTSVPPQVQVPPIVLLRQLQRIDLALQHLQPLLPLRPPHNLPHLWRQDVKGCNRLAVVVVAHVEGLDVLGVVEEDNWPVEDVLTQVSLVFRSEVHSPLDFVFALREGVSLLDHLRNDSIGTF